ncbi:MAG TPA: glycosyltransferase family 4 protein, partial [Verrucomicrobiae bacterium]|nr:glycosyltransferase family 4 protein [Verrucomicrobiae bacterium]
MTYKIAIVVHGRFYAFSLAKALLARGHDVVLFTNYPKWAVKRFGFPVGRVRSHWVHGITTRLFHKAQDKLHTPFPEPWLHADFGRWAAREVTRENWDVVYCFSGVAEELFTALHGSTASRWLVRASSHIRTQATILEQEERRAGVPINRPSIWMIAREEREYAIADRIVVLSSFAYESFEKSGLSHKLLLMPLGVSVQHFRASPEKIESRRQRILSGAPLRVLFVGTKSFRKGLVDLARVACLVDKKYQLRLVGAAEAGARGLLDQMSSQADLQPPVPERELPHVYEWGDVFIFPTVEDGFPVVLAQAHASGLPILATTNCSARELLRD